MACSSMIRVQLALEERAHARKHLRYRRGRDCRGMLVDRSAVGARFRPLDHATIPLVIGQGFCGDRDTTEHGTIAPGKMDEIENELVLLNGVGLLNRGLFGLRGHCVFPSTHVKEYSSGCQYVRC